MDRRHLLRVLGGTAAFGCLTPSQLEALLRPDSPRRPVQALFSEAQRAAVEAIVDRVIPITDTPGAVEVGVVEYVEMIVADWYEDAERDHFLAGLADIDERARAQGVPSFSVLDGDRQDRLLATLEREGRAAGAGSDAEDPSVELGSFFHQVRGLALHGYYTSEVGMMVELRFAPIPGRYDGSAPLAQLVRATPGGQ